MYIQCTNMHELLWNTYNLHRIVNVQCYIFYTRKLLTYSRQVFNCMINKYMIQHNVCVEQIIGFLACQTESKLLEFKHFFVSAGISFWNFKLLVALSKTQSAPAQLSALKKCVCEIHTSLYNCRLLFNILLINR